jgi:hypothetical protein
MFRVYLVLIYLTGVLLIFPFLLCCCRFYDTLQILGSHYLTLESRYTPHCTISRYSWWVHGGFAELCRNLMPLPIPSSAANSNICFHPVSLRVMERVFYLYFQLLSETSKEGPTFTAHTMHAPSLNAWSQTWWFACSKYKVCIRSVLWEVRANERKWTLQL